MNKGQKPAENLFTYTGKATINACSLYLDYKNIIGIHIERTKFDFWDSMLSYDEDGDDSSWVSLNTKYEDLNYDGYNNKKYYIERIKTYDNETKTFTTTKEIRKR